MKILAEIKYKLLGAAIIIALLVSAFFYVKHLNNTIDSLKENTVKMNTEITSLKETNKEEDRRDSIVKEVTVIYEPLRKQVEADYQKKVIDIDNDVKEGKDRPVGPLLRDFFNRVPNNSNDTVNP